MVRLLLRDFKWRHLERLCRILRQDVEAADPKWDRQIIPSHLYVHANTKIRCHGNAITEDRKRYFSLPRFSK